MTSWASASSLVSDTLGLVDRTEFVRFDATRQLDPERRGALGQFLTPPPIARFMASMFETPRDRISLLDPGAGVGSLTAAFVESMSARSRPPKEISVTACELDPTLCEDLEGTLRACGAAAQQAGTRFRGQVLHGDFIEIAEQALGAGLFAPVLPQFNCAILNPPYHKIRSDSKHRSLLSNLGIETSNLYTAFLAVVVRLLEPGGELVAITPRSFCNGTYFESFRKSFLHEMTLRRLHVFEARDQAFGDDEVLQENLILHAVKSRSSRKVIVSASDTPDDAGSTRREVEQSEIVQSDDRHQFIRLVSTALGQQVAERMSRFDRRSPSSTSASPPDGLSTSGQPSICARNQSPTRLLSSTPVISRMASSGGPTPRARSRMPSRSIQRPPTFCFHRDTSCW